MRLILASLALFAVPLYAQEPSPTPAPQPTQIPCSLMQPLTPEQEIIGRNRDENMAVLDMAPPAMRDSMMKGPLHLEDVIDDRSTADARRQQYCSSSAVAIGVVRSRVFLLSPLRRWVWGESAFEIEEVLKNDPVAPLTPGVNVMVARSGGAVCLAEYTRAIHTGAAPLVEGARYVLFMHHDGASGRYLAHDPGYQLNGAVAMLATEGVGQTIAANELLNELRTVGPCE